MDHSSTQLERKLTDSRWEEELEKGGIPPPRISEDVAVLVKDTGKRK